MAYCRYSTSVPEATPSATRWDLVDLSCTQIIAQSACQQRKFFQKFGNVSNRSPSKEMVMDKPLVELFVIDRDTRPPSPADSLYADPVYMPLQKLEALQMVESPRMDSSAYSSQRSSGVPSSVFSMVSEASSASSTGSLSPNAHNNNISETESPSHFATTPETACDLKYACPNCNSSYRTPGQLSSHNNRMHNLRFVCSNCDAKFGLKSDLERHKHTKHKKLFGPLATFCCTNEGCATPGKKFHRKDNFRRHVERCRQAVLTRGTAC